MTGIDIVFSVIVAVSALRCATRGFISEFLSIAALIFGLMAAISFYRSAAVFVRAWFMQDVKIVPEIIAFIALLLIIYIIIKIIEIVLKTVVNGIRLGDMDHLLGFILGFAEGLIIVCLILFLISIQPFIDTNRILEGSIFARILLPLITGQKRIQEAFAVLEGLRRCAGV